MEEFKQGFMIAGLVVSVPAVIVCSILLFKTETMDLKYKKS